MQEWFPAPDCCPSRSTRWAQVDPVRPRPQPATSAGRTRRTRPAKTRSACSQFTIVFDGECVLANTVFSRATLGIIFPLLFWFYFFAFVRGRYGSGLHIRATMPWLHYRLKTGGEAEGPRIKVFFPQSLTHFCLQLRLEPRGDVQPRSSEEWPCEVAVNRFDCHDF